MTEITCPHCSNSDNSMMELELVSNRLQVWYCGICSKNFNIVVKVGAENEDKEINKERP